MSVSLKKFVGRQQLHLLQRLSTGEEGDHFLSILAGLKNTLSTMPATYETDGQGDEAILQLHYFTGASDWWIIERDSEAEQLQAFGFVCLNGWADSAELGYINIAELIKHGAEIDLYWTPKPLSEIRKNVEARLLSAAHF